MLPYWLLFTFCAAGALEHRRREARPFQGGPLLLLAGLILATMIGLRYEVGGDWLNYLEIFEFFRFADFGKAMQTGDPGFALLNWIAQWIGADIWFVNVVCAVVFAWGLTKFARNQPNPWLVLVVAVPYLIIVVAMGYMRQGVAIGFLLAGLATLQKSSIARFAIYVALAATFHKTAIVILPLVAIAMIQQRSSASFAIVVVGALLYYFFLQSAVDRLLAVYEQAAYESQGAVIRVAMNLVPASIFLLAEKRFELPPQETRLWRYFSLASFGALFLLVVLESTTVVDRLALYLIPVQLFVLSRLPYAFSSNGKPNGQVALAVILYSAAVQFVWLNYSTHADSWLPYQFYPTTEESRLDWYFQQ